MASSEREKTMLVWVAVVGGLGLAYYFVGQPIFDQIESLDAQITQADKTYSDNVDVLARRAKNQKTWDDLVKAGLKSDETTAQQQLIQALENWKTRSGITVASQRIVRTTQDPKKQFSIIGFDIQATGAMRNVDNYLWAIETSPLPIQLNECTLGAVKDGQDQVNLHIQVTALCEPPAGSKPAPQPAADTSSDNTTGGNP